MKYNNKEVIAVKDHSFDCDGCIFLVEEKFCEDACIKGNFEQLFDLRPCSMTHSIYKYKLN